MSDMTPAARAREAALSVEAKKHALRQQQDGCWIMTLRVHQNDMPEAVMKAAMGTRYQLAMVEIGDDEQPVSQRVPYPPSPSAGEKPGVATTHRVPAVPLRAAKEKRKWANLSYPQQAGIRCSDPVFWAFLRETKRSHCNDEADATDYVRHVCSVTSRAEINPDLASGLIWGSLDAAYDDWQALDRVSA